MKPWREYSGRVVRYGLVVLLVAIVSIAGINIWVVASTSGRIYEDVALVPPARVALLLGTSRNTARGANVFFMHRIDAAAALYHAGKVQKIIVSGDNSEVDYNETQAMRDELVKMGVPDEDIVDDFAGFRTLDSVVRAKSVFDQNEVIVVSQRFHVQRALFIADAHDIKATGFVAKDPSLGLPYYKVMMREYFARVKAALDCYVLGTEPKFPGPKEPIVF